MCSTTSLIALVTILASILPQVNGSDYPIDIINHKRYEGTYVATQQGQTFNYLNGKQGKIFVGFYGQDKIDSMRIRLLDPIYEDTTIAIVQVKEIIDIGDKKEWRNQNHNATISTVWRRRFTDQYQVQNVSTAVQFINLEKGDYESVEVRISMKGQNFQFNGYATHPRKLYSIINYGIYVCFLACIQIVSWVKLIKRLNRNFVFHIKLSLLTVFLCGMQATFQSTKCVEYFMLGLPIYNTIKQSDYLYFLIPIIALTGTFMADYYLFQLVQRNHDLRNGNGGANLREVIKKLALYIIKILIGFLIYAVLNAFFQYQEWFIILNSLTLVPQIIFNISVGVKSQFNSIFIFGYIGTRLLLPIYQSLCPANIFHLTPNPRIAILIIILYVLQVLLLYLQYKFGPRFLIPNRFQPDYYDYKLNLTKDDSNKEMDCSICLKNLFEQAGDKSEQNGINPVRFQIQQPIQEKVQVFNTPCNHKFHKQCLEEWVKVRLQCPNCRRNLPPFYS